MLVEKLHLQTGIPIAKIHRIALSSSRRYRTYYIPKRNGGRRQINHPGKELKAIQRWVVAAVIDRLPVHECAMAYKKGTSIRANAMIHLGSKFTLRMDFRDFFPSFDGDGVGRFLKDSNDHLNLGLDDADLSFVRDIVTKSGELTIGAPSSPPLTNAMMFQFDVKISSYCAEAGLRYSRYADDLYISAFEPGKLQAAFERVQEAVAEYSYANLLINNDKTKFLSRKYKRTVTGLVVTPNNRISIGRAKKREIKSLIHSYSVQTLAPEFVGYLQGYISYISDVEPDFLESLRKKYGDDLLIKLANE